ncbi:MAG: ABC transporter permease, partial [Roseicyclus sp.]|nr:ABC transporter permease [Roseicyclus sp.]
MSRLIQKNAWSLGLLLLLGALLITTKVIQPNFGATGLESLARSALPFAFATAAMAIVVIAGGIDLSIASMMSVCGVTAAVLMQHMGAVPAVAITLCVGGAMGAINGGLIVLTKVPDIVVTLAMLFVWEGVALLILTSPGGNVSDGLRSLISGALIPGVPNALIFMVVAV